MQYQVTTLKNGATLLRIPMASAASVTVLALVNAGRRYEDERVAGISHFLEHMVFKGTKKYPTPQALSAVVDEVGGEFNAFTSKEYTGYYVKLAARFTDLALDVVTDLLCTPQLRQEDIDREVGVILEEMNMYEDMPMRNVGDVFEELMFAGSNLAGRILGTKEAVRSLKTADFQQYLHDWYGFKNIVFVVAGNAAQVNDPGLEAKVEEMLAKGGSDRQAGEQRPYFQKRYGADKINVVQKKTEQAHFIMGFPGYDRNDERRYGLSVLSTLMGKTMSSRLFTEIREKRGLCYYVRSETDFYHDVGVFGASAGVDPNRVNEAVGAMRAEFMAAVGAKPVTEAEVNAAKQNLIGSLLLELEDSHSVASWYGMKQLLEGKVETEEETIASLEKITLESVQNIAQDLLQPEQLRFALIGPFSQTDIKIA
jgi:predicted Zn-dependent peptidase